MTDIDTLLLSRIYQLAKICVIEYEAILPKIKNPDIQTLLSNQSSNYDLIVKECSTLAKANNVALPESTFFKRCHETIATNFETLKFNTLDPLITSATITSLHILMDIYDLESASSETISIAKHFKALQDNFLNALAEIK